MRVQFDSRPASDHRGIGRYSRCLLSALQDAHPGQVTESPRPHPRSADVFHAPWIDGAPLRPPMPTVVTIHDLIPLRRRTEYLRSGLRFRMRYLAASRATRVIVPTQVVAADAERMIGIPQERIAVIPEAAAPVFAPRPRAEVAAVRAQLGIPDRYLLWVGGLRTPDPRKRVAALAAAPRTLPLVLAGPHAPWTQRLTGDAILTGEVSDDQLAALYTGAHALVFPSDDEGFGLPPVEALACGTPVVASDVPAVREVLGGGGATLVPVDDIPGLVAAAEAARRPAPPAPAWRWADAAAATWEIYASALGASGPRTRRLR